MAEVGIGGGGSDGTESMLRRERRQLKAMITDSLTEEKRQRIFNDRAANMHSVHTLKASHESVMKDQLGA